MDTFDETFNRYTRGEMTIEELDSINRELTKEIISNKISELGRCKVKSYDGYFTSRCCFGFGNWDDGDVISSYDELIKLASLKGHNESMIIREYNLGILEFKPV